MNNNVCMYVWNHFTNDARVLRECTALSDQGYHVDLVCIHDPDEQGLPMYDERNENFRVFRVRRYPLMLEFIQNVCNFLLANKIIGAAALALWLMCFYLSPLIIGSFSLLLLILLKTKVKVAWVRGSIILRMILKGYNSKYSIYHSNDLNTLPQGYICSKLRFNKRLLIYDSHEVQTSRTGYDSSYHGKLESFLITRIDSMIVENHTRAQYNDDLYGFYPSVVHNYPFQSEKNHNQESMDIYQMLGIPIDEKILLYQGGIQTGRGLDKLIKAAPLFKEGILVFIGDGKIKPELERMVEDMELGAKVKFLPKVPLEELPLYTRNAYLGFQVLNNVCFNHYSASSNKLFEYMMSGVPVVACNFPEIRKVVENENMGICVDSHDHEDIAHAVNLILENEELRNKYSTNAFRASEHYNWEREKNSLLHVYSSLTA
ncbi:glycosyltransferase [Halobacillus litoralis]|nr:glycosyltransferase [Halobacillus litoralis]MCA1021044.1 glycosyltransferase [Halobacillus litoralis]